MEKNEEETEGDLNLGTDRKLLTNDERLSKSTEVRKRGSEFYEQGDIENAIKYYHIASMLIKDIGTVGPFTAFSPEDELASKELMDRVNAEKALSYNNLALILLGKEHYDRACHYSWMATRFEPNNYKARWRNCKTAIISRMWEQAEESLNKLRELEPEIDHEEFERHRPEIEVEAKAARERREERERKIAEERAKRKAERVQMDRRRAMVQKGKGKGKGRGLRNGHVETAFNGEIEDKADAD